MRVLLWIILVAGFPHAGLAQTIFKCTDGKGVTYSNTACDKLGLKQAGEVEDRVTTFPPLPATAAPAAPAKKPPAPGPAGEADTSKGGAKSPNPMGDVLRK